MVLVNGLTLEESRLKRLEKQQSRYRHRFGTFVPAEHNPLLDTLLARGINGESPSPQKPPSSSPRRTVRSRRRAPSKGEDDEAHSPRPVKRSRTNGPRKRVETVVEGEKAERKSSSSRSKSTRRRGSETKKASALKARADSPEQEVDPTSSIFHAKPSGTGLIKARASGSSKSRLKTRIVDDGSESESTERHTSKTRKRALPQKPSQSTASLKRKLADDNDDDNQTNEAKPKSAETTSRRKAAAKTKQVDHEQTPVKPPGPRKNRSAKAKVNIPGSADTEDKSNEVESRPKAGSNEEKKPPAGRKRRKIESEQDEDLASPKPAKSLKLNTRSRKENTTIANPKTLNKPKPKLRRTAAFKLPKFTRFGSPLRPASDDEDKDPIDFLS